MIKQKHICGVRYLTSLLVFFLVSGCTGVPEGVEPVRGFELERYLGSWYEIARLDHSFERGLSEVTANYALREDGAVRVLNRGYSAQEKSWDEAEGKAYFVGDQDVGHLKVSFFGPFYGAYVVFGLDREDYQYAFVAGPDTSYLWLLAREPQVSEEVLQRFIRQARELGFATDELIYVEHSGKDPE
jgi:apolipoprotein D and lipocalin family protein